VKPARRQSLLAALAVLTLAMAGVESLAQTPQPWGSVVVYQPLVKDAGVNSAQWQQIWAQTRAHGFSTVLVQWTAYGDERFGAESNPAGKPSTTPSWLWRALQQAQRQGLDLVVGLAADPNYFQLVQRPGWQASFSDDWLSLQRQSLAQQQRLQPLLQRLGLAVKGWYLPAELSDRLFGDRGRRESTLTQLVDLAARLDRPLHVSAYSTGQLTPAANASWLLQLQQAGLVVWWQDGQGTAELPALVRQAYATALPCPVGVIREAFRELSTPPAPFVAVPAVPQPPLPCHPNAVFALQYLPWAGALRPSPPASGAGS